MMRWIVIALVVINAAYFVWQRQFAAVPVAEVTAHAEREHQLRLASELTKVAAPAPAPLSSHPPAPAVVAPPHEADSNNHQNREARTAAVPPVTAVAKAEQPAPATAAHSQLRACYSIGPFSLVNDVSGTASIFEGADGMATQQRATAERTQVGYWVYVPPLDTMQSARAVLRDLQNREIREVLIISEGVKANAISAGIYSTEPQAQERRDAIRAFGYRAEIDPLYRTQPQYWLDIELTKSQTIPEKLWQKVGKKFPNITRTERPCE